MAVDLLEVCRCFNELWDTPVESGGCLMTGFGCDEHHALKECMKIRAAVWKHPTFDLNAGTQLESSIECLRCECTGCGDSDDENVVDVDEESPICGHCDGTCWCEQRYWVGGEVDFDFDRGVEVDVIERKRNVCETCSGRGILVDGRKRDK